MGTIGKIVVFLLLVQAAHAQFYQQIVFWPTNTVVNSQDVTFTNNLRLVEDFFLGGTNSIIDVPSAGKLEFRGSSTTFKMILADNVADLKILSYGFGYRSNETYHPQISWKQSDSNAVYFEKQDGSAFIDTRQGNAFVSGNLYITNVTLAPVETRPSTDTNVVIDIVNSSPYQIITVTNDFILGITNYFAGAAMAIKLDPVDNSTNYTITVDSTWERYGTNYGSATIVIQPTKGAIVSVTSLGTTGAGVASSVRYER